MIAASVFALAGVVALVLPMYGPQQDKDWLFALVVGIGCWTAAALCASGAIR